jgi:hypothetical protein
MPHFPHVWAHWVLKDKWEKLGREQEPGQGNWSSWPGGNKKDAGSGEGGNLGCPNLNTRSNQVCLSFSLLFKISLGMLLHIYNPSYREADGEG